MILHEFSVVIDKLYAATRKIIIQFPLFDNNISGISCVYIEQTT